MVPLLCNAYVADIARMLGNTPTVHVMLHPGHTHLRGIDANLHIFANHGRYDNDLAGGPATGTM
eukprot:12134259-Prorocentrum_lima.AAC.1